MQLAILRDNAPELWRIDAQARVERGPLPDNLKTPLGSLWKLFIYDYLVTNEVTEAPYRCSGQDPEEVYCCEPGESIERDKALVKSCGLYFNPHRLSITAETWDPQWSKAQAPAWLKNLDQIRPDREVQVAELLNALSLLPSQAQARKVLLDKLLVEPLARSNTESGSAPVATLGSRLRVKTWSWHNSNQGEQRIGGFAGWLADGAPLWASAAGTSQQIFENYAFSLNRLLPVPSSIDPEPCVEVSLFERYPIRSIADAQHHPLNTPGALHGGFTVEFVNGNRLAIEGQGDLYLTFSTPSSGSDSRTIPRLVARLEREEYIARVLDREASPVPEEAAKALAIAARTYLLQNANKSTACLQIADSSHLQRVAPRPATAAARRIANWTQDLVLAGAAVTYHQSEAGTSQLSWQLASEQANLGWRYDRILAHAFVQANLARWDSPAVNCPSLPNARQWLGKQLILWRERLNREPGYQETKQFQVCRLLAGKAHVDRSRKRIYVRNLVSLEDRLDLTHEYLHLAFAEYPSGQDENYIENLARTLLLQ